MWLVNLDALTGPVIELLGIAAVAGALLAGAYLVIEHQTHLFEPFYTTKAQGTGLGLAISAHIITQHNGQIEVASAVGVGTTFTVHLPVLTPSG